MRGRQPKVRRASPAMGLGVLVLVFIGIALLAIGSMRCAAAEAMHHPPKDQEQAG